MTNLTNPTAVQLAASVVIFSAHQATQSGDGAGFWSNSEGWSGLEGATLFTLEESRTFGLPLGAARDATWLPGADAQRAVLEALIKKELVNDGFDVARAPDGRWYWADEQDRDEVTAGDHATESLAWRDLAEARRHVLEDGDLDADGVFVTTASSRELAEQHHHQSADAATTVHTALRDEAEYELRVCGRGDTAYFEWVDQLGDPVGTVFEQVDFDQIEATLAPIERDGPRASRG